METETLEDHVRRATRNFTSSLPEDQVLALGSDSVEVGSWLGFGISHPCTVFDKWQLIPELDADDRVVGLVRTFF